MTIFEWYYLRRKATDHPFFDAHPHMLSKKESDKAIKESAHMTGKEFMDSIYAQAGMERPQPQEKKIAKPANILSCITLPPVRKIIIVVAALILITLFFTVTPTGRAMADNMIQFVLKQFGGNILLNTPISMNEDADSAIFAASNVNSPSFSLKQFYDKTGFKAVQLSLECKSASFDEESGDYYLISKYVTKEGLHIFLTQEWNILSGNASTTNSIFQIYPNSIPSLMYSIDSTDNSIYAILTLDDSVLYLRTESGISIDELYQILHNDGIC